MSLGFRLSPVQRHLLWHGGTGAPLPRDAEGEAMRAAEMEGVAA